MRIIVFNIKTNKRESAPTRRGNGHGSINTLPRPSGDSEPLFAYYSKGFRNAVSLLRQTLMGSIYKIQLFLVSVFSVINNFTKIQEFLHHNHTILIIFVRLIQIDNFQLLTKGTT